MKRQAKTSTTPRNGRVTVDLNQSLGHPHREKRFQELPDEVKQACAENTRRRAARINLNELDPDCFANIDREVEEMQSAVRALAVLAMLMAHTLAAVRHEVGVGDCAHDVLWRTVGELPREMNATADYALDSVRGVECQLRAAGVLLEEEPEQADS